MPVDREKVRRCLDVYRSLDELNEEVHNAAVSVARGDVAAATEHLDFADELVANYIDMRSMADTSERIFATVFHNWRRQFDKLAAGQKVLVGPEAPGVEPTENTMGYVVAQMRKTVQTEHVIKVCGCALGEIGPSR